MEDWRGFRRRYRHVIDEIADRYPGFWEELRDLAESRERRWTTTRGATVREFPRTRDQETQAAGGRTLGQCLFGVAAYQPVGIQTEVAPIRTTGSQTDPAPDVAAVPLTLERRGRGRGIRAPTATRRPGPEEVDRLTPSESPRNDRSIGEPGRKLSSPIERVGAAPRPPTRGSNVCWNCRATDHRYSNCPLPRDRQYCYGCGRDGVTLRTCPSCREEWKDLGPYHPDRGHLGH